MAVEINSVRARLVPSTRFLLGLLICFGFFIQFAQRINLSIAIVCMVNKTGLNLPSESKNNIIPNTSRTNSRATLFFQEQQFLWSEWHQQIILGSYWGGYLLTLVPSGWLSITMGAKSIYAMSLCISSLATIALSSIYFLQKNSFLLVVCLRVLIGAAHGTVFPVTYTLWAHWAVPDERGTLSSIGFSGTQLGTSFIVLVGGLLCRYVNAGWMYIFLLSGILGFLWLPLWLWQVSDSPADHRSISHTEREYIENIIGKNVANKNRRPVSLGALPWKKIIRSKPVLGLFLTELCNLFGLFFFLSNLGKILTEIHGISSQYTGYILACGFFSMLVGNISVGIIADRLVRKKLMTLTNVRKLFNSLTSFIPCLCMIAFYFCDEKRQILGVITVILFLFTSGFAYGSGYVVNFSDVVPAYAGLFFGIATSISSLSAVIGNIIAGILIKHPTLHDWRRLFLLFFVVYLIGGIVYLVLGSAIPEKWATLKSLEKEEKDAHSPEETMPMKELQGLDEPKDIEDEQTRNVQA